MRLEIIPVANTATAIFFKNLFCGFFLTSKDMATRKNKTTSGKHLTIFPPSAEILKAVLGGSAVLSPPCPM
jgi:hypothetical protein